jgi:NAD(P)H-flavin reductase
MFKIVKKEVLAPSLTEFVIEAPLVACKRKPGNFVILRVNEKGERIPLTIVDSDQSAGTITLIVQTIGKTTKLLSLQEEGGYLLDVVGPLGNPTPIELHGTAVCIGGGVGTAEVFPIAKALKDAGNRVITIVGAKTRELVILEEELRAFCDTLFITTDDGSYGRKGFVSDQLQDLLSSDGRVDVVYAIGPVIMMKVISEMTKPYKIPTFVSLNPIMMDGTGMCGACRVSVGGKMKFACVDGPEFDGHQVDFGELIQRNRTYVDLENLSMEEFEAGLCRLKGETMEMAHG